MKTCFLTILITILISYQGICQQFMSDSICYYRSYTGERVRCDIPTLDPAYSTYYRDMWKVERDGDFITITQFYRYYANSDKGIGLEINFQVESKNEEKTTYPFSNKKIKVSKQYLTGTASSTRVYSLGLEWDLYDLNGDGIWDRLTITWTEANSPLVRVIYCHLK